MFIKRGEGKIISVVDTKEIENKKDKKKNVSKKIKKSDQETEKKE